MGKKIIRLTESELYDIVNKVVNEQKPDHLMPGQPDNPLNPDGAITKYKNELKKLRSKYKCVEPEISLAIHSALSQGVDKWLVRYGVGILHRESDYGKSIKYYGKSNVEYGMNKLSEMFPWFKEIIQDGAKTVFDKDNWVPSMGVAQMTPDIAKKYGLNLEDLMSISGSLTAVTKHLSDLYKQMLKYYESGSSSMIINKGKLIVNPSSSGNAALDAAITSYNLGPNRFTKQYCRTNSSKLMAPCDSPNGIYRPYAKSRPDFKLKVDPKKVVKNYIPKISTDTTGTINKVLNKYVRDTPSGVQSINSLGYIKEVVSVANKIDCL